MRLHAVRELEGFALHTKGRLDACTCGSAQKHGTARYEMACHPTGIAKQAIKDEQVSVAITGVEQTAGRMDTGHDLQSAAE